MKVIGDCDICGEHKESYEILRDKTGEQRIILICDDCIKLMEGIIKEYETLEEGIGITEENEISKIIEERYATDDGTRYTTEEIIEKRDVRSKNVIGEITKAEKMISEIEE